jgi:hypothetical protein
MEKRVYESNLDRMGCRMVYSSHLECAVIDDFADEDSFSPE